MSALSLDSEALVRAILVGFGVGLLMAAIVYFLTRVPGPERARWRQALMMGATGFALLAVVITYYVWPSLVQVPRLDGMSQAEAEDILLRSKLNPDPRLLYATGVPAGRVVPGSQSPVHGLAVRPGTSVSFAINQQDVVPPAAQPGAGLSLSIFEPRAGARARVNRSGDGLYRLAVTGASAGVAADRNGLLLWARPVSPPSNIPGWYLQRPPVNGITSFQNSGAWAGLIQIGDQAYPPMDGQTVDIAVTIADRAQIDRLFAQPGVVILGQPQGVQTAVAKEVVLTLK